MTKLKKGDVAPNFELQDQEGNTVALSSYGSKKLLLYFYPKADTPGCTKQACSIRDAKADLIREKDVLLEKEEVRIRDRYAKETEDIVEQIEEEEKSTIQKLTNACEKNIGKVVDYIASEIVKE